MKSLLYITFVAALGSKLCYAQQELNLFQATDSNEDRQANTRQPQRDAQRNTEPAFTLVGTSRFGEKYYASLRSRDGNAVKVEWNPGIVKEIEGYRDYSIAGINSRSVSIRMPESDPCIESEEKGIECNGNMAVLRLSTAKPLATRPVNNTDSNQPVVTAQIGGVGFEDSDEESEFTGDRPETIGNTNVLLRNPFSGELQTARELSPEELAAREEQRRQRAERFRNFEIIRIPDDEIPEGMRRLRTPFGDSLEPIED